MSVKRLVYAPKVFAYLQTDKGLVDISDDIVSGSVSRKINQVSQAQITLRNRDMKYTEKGNPVFHPMDPITIYLQRVPKSSIQVFTGYLDSSTMMQLYPGNMELMASCTLKRLLHTYWDMGLPFTAEFMGQYGWVVNPASGQLINPTAAQEDVKEDLNLNDGSIAQLLYATLKHVGTWNPDSILIEKLPEELPIRIADIFTHFEEENQDVKRRLKEFFEKIIGYVPPGLSLDVDTDSSDDAPPVTGSGGGAAAVKWARHYLGTRERGTSNRGTLIDKWSKVYGLTAQPWCGIFVGNATSAGGANLCRSIVSVPDARDAVRAGSCGFEKGEFHKAKYARPGDVVFLHGYNHIGLVEGVRGGSIVSIEGNTSVGGGDGVGRKTHSSWDGLGRPKYP